LCGPFEKTAWKRGSAPKQRGPAFATEGPQVPKFRGGQGRVKQDSFTGSFLTREQMRTAVASKDHRNASTTKEQG